jgi:N6-L-threonylcarbamoyladenine synthase
LIPPFPPTTPLLCLGVESTAHTIGMAVASTTGDIVTNVNVAYSAPLGRGIHPREAAQHHSEVIPSLLRRVIESLDVGLDEVDCIAFSAGPGLGPVLRTGATFARALALWLDKPLVPVHHAIGHIEIASLMTGARDPLVLLVSGGHTSIVAFGDGFWRVYGETEDITLGNLLDVFAREAGLAFPGGAVIEALARTGRTFVELPYVVKGNDVSYSGLLTAALKQLRAGTSIEDMCFSLQEVAFAMLTEATERALAHTERTEVLVTGGVAANARLQDMIRSIARDHGAQAYMVPKAYSGDSGAQIAWTGLLAFQSGVRVEVDKSFVKPKWRLDQVRIPWR